jgi:hypothetical protein
VDEPSAEFVNVNTEVDNPVEDPQEESVEKADKEPVMEPVDEVAKKVIVDVAAAVAVASAGKSSHESVIDVHLEKKLATKTDDKEMEETVSLVGANASAEEATATAKGLGSASISMAEIKRLDRKKSSDDNHSASKVFNRDNIKMIIKEEKPEKLAEKRHSIRDHNK